MEVGLIEWFNEKKGFGVFTTLDNKEVFFHISNWKDSSRFDHSNKLPLVFEIGVRRKKATALNCKYFNATNCRDWEALLAVNYHKNVNNLIIDIIDELSIYMIENYDVLDIQLVLKMLVGHVSEDNILDSGKIIFNLYLKSTNERLNNDIFELLKNRINGFSDSTIMEFWKSNTIPRYIPENELLIRNANKVGMNELAVMDSVNTKHLIILSKLSKLLEDFSIDEYFKFQDYLTIVESQGLKIKIIQDLNFLAKSNYWDWVLNQVINLTKKPHVSYFQLNDYIQSQPFFLDTEITNGIMGMLEENIYKNCSFEVIVDCWQNRIIEFSIDLLNEKIEYGNNEDLQYFLNSTFCTRDLARPVLDSFFIKKEYAILLKQAIRFDEEIYNKYDSLVFDEVSQDTYFSFWQNGVGKTTPFGYLSDFLDFDKDKYVKLEKWVENGMIDKEEARSLLLNSIESLSQINSRYDFYKLLYSIEYLINNTQGKITPLLDRGDKFVLLILWHLKVSEDFDLEWLSGRFVYFKPEDQVYVFKRLFYLKHIGKLQFDIRILDRVVRADLDIHIANCRFSDDITIDISTHIIIECIKAFVENNNFTFKSSYIFKDLQHNSKHKFIIENYFDLCKGRALPNWRLYYDIKDGVAANNWESNSGGRILKKWYGESKFYYAIEFSPTLNVVAYNYYGSYSYHKKNPNFTRLKEEVKKLPRRKWNNDLKHWGVPAKYEKEVLAFGSKNRFYIDFKDSNDVKNNKHLLQFDRWVKDPHGSGLRRNIPRGIIHCEGRKASRLHSVFGTEYWWCVNQECHRNCVDTHLKCDSESLEKDVWEDYTLLDILRILKINVDEIKGEEVVKDGHYYKLLGHVNAFNRLVNKLYCEECESMLYPVKSSNFALYRVVKFHCVNINCSKNHQEIYLSQCLNGECKTVIDSRVSKRCCHGLYICHHCGTCCSEESFVRRLRSLRKLGGYIHSKLILNVKKQNGHLEKKEYYCYKCSEMTTEINDNTFQCLKCNVTYNLNKFKWLKSKWTKLDRRRNDYPTF